MDRFPVRLLPVLAAALLGASVGLGQAPPGARATVPDGGLELTDRGARDRLATWLQEMGVVPEPVGARTLWVRRNAGQYVIACAHDAGAGFLWVYVPGLAQLPEDREARAALLEWLLRQNGQRFVGSFSIKDDGSVYYEWAGPLPAEGEKQLFRTVWELLDAEAPGLQSQIAAIVADAHLQEDTAP